MRRGLRDRLPKLEDVFSIDDFAALRERGRKHDGAELAERVAAVTPEDGYTIIYTSGTTGPPKGAVLPRRSIASNLDALGRARGRH